MAVNRLLEPRSELFVHEKWFPQTAMDLLLDTDALVADKDRLYRCLDRLPAHKTALEKHLAARGQDLLGLAQPAVSVAVSGDGLTDKPNIGAEDWRADWCLR